MLSVAHTHTHTHTRWEPQNNNKARKAVKKHVYTLSGVPCAGSSKQIDNGQQVTGAHGQLQLGFTKLSLSIREHFGYDVSLLHTHDENRK